mgnify:CR=1 FL=1
MGLRCFARVLARYHAQVTHLFLKFEQRSEQFFTVAQVHGLIDALIYRVAHCAIQAFRLHHVPEVLCFRAGVANNVLVTSQIAFQHVRHHAL